MRLKHRYCFLIAALLLLVRGEALAEYDPPFEMDMAIGEADLIVRAQIDSWDRLAVEEVFAGSPGTNRIELDTWSRTFRQLTLPEGQRGDAPSWKNAWRWLVGPRHVEVVAFLRRAKAGWTTGGGSMDFVLLRGDGVYPFNGWEYEERKPTYTRRAFFEALGEAIRVKTERKRLLALPRSLERSSALLRLALTHEPLPAANDFMSMGRPYHLEQIARGFYKPSAEEEELVLRALTDEQTAKQKLKALDLAQLIPLTPAAFDTIARYVDRSYPPEIRRAALMTLPLLDSPRTTEFLAPLLTRAEPELETAVRSLWSAVKLSVGTSRSVALVDRLLSLVNEFKTPPGNGAVTDNRISAQMSGLLQMVELYQHPRLIPVLIESSVSGKPFGTGAARGALSRITTFKFRDEDPSAWQRWWESAGSMLDPEYDLHTEAGRAAWRAAWAYDDAAMRRLLVNFWLFEPSFEPAKALFQEAPESDATLAAVTALWEHRCLAPELEKAIVERFFKFVLVEFEPYRRLHPTHRDVFILHKTCFVFPKKTDVQFRSCIVVGEDNQAVLPEAWPQQPATYPLDVGRDTRWGQLEGDYSGAPIARAIIELRSVEAARPENVRWTARFDLGPIQLRDIPK